MEIITLKNSEIEVKVSTFGAELHSIVKNGVEHLWHGDPKFWNRHSPVLFPTVGRVWQNEYRYNGATYKLGQHGFARDNEFVVESLSADEVEFSLKSNDATRAVYPFDFVLKIGYKLTGSTVAVTWQVENRGEGWLPFQIGAHPAFMFADFDVADDLRGYVSFGDAKDIKYITPTEGGCVSPDLYDLELDSEGMMEIRAPHAFDCDTFVMENGQIDTCTLHDKNRKPYITVKFDMPLVALWAPMKAHEDVPFLCIEPWCGRCDYVGYQGDFGSRPYNQLLRKGENWATTYTITLHR